jgi:NTP pyrophosphatase (non-canonical NTP hydrolase)
VNSWMASQAPHIAARLAEGGFEPDDTALHLAAEAGEFIGAWTRYTGRARRDGTEDEARIELADVVIAAYVLAHQHGWNLDEAISRTVLVDPKLDGVNLVLAVSAKVGGFITLWTTPIQRARQHAPRALGEVVLVARRIATAEKWDLAGDIARKVEIGFERGFGERGKSDGD